MFPAGEKLSREKGDDNEDRRQQDQHDRGYPRQDIEYPSIGKPSHDTFVVDQYQHEDQNNGQQNPIKCLTDHHRLDQGLNG